MPKIAQIAKHYYAQVPAANGVSLHRSRRPDAEEGIIAVSAAILSARNMARRGARLAAIVRK